MRTSFRLSIVLLIVATVIVSGCNRRRTPVAAPTAPPPAAVPPSIAPAQPGQPPQRVDEALPVPQQPLADDEIGNRSLDDLNRNSPLKPVFFAYDSAELDDTARATAMGNADVLRKYGNWIITIEGHCDERGTREYNLALGERRAVSVKAYLVSLGISPDRIRTVSYGNEFPFDPGKTEDAFSKNRRGHFVITSN